MTAVPDGSLNNTFQTSSVTATNDGVTLFRSSYAPLAAAARQQQRAHGYVEVDSNRPVRSIRIRHLRWRQDDITSMTTCSTNDKIQNGEMWSIVLETQKMISEILKC